MVVGKSVNVKTKHTMIVKAANIPNEDIGTRGVNAVTIKAEAVVNDVLNTDCADRLTVYLSRSTSSL